MAFARAMVLGAGFGTRLRPLTDERPKPLVPIGDRTLLERIVGGLRDAGVDHLVVNAHHLPDAIAAAGHSLGVAVIREARILGTAGGVSHAGDALGSGDVLVVNGDILAETNFTALEAHHMAAGAVATLAVAEPREPGRGTLGIDRAGRVVRLRGEVFGEEIAGADFVGVQVLTAEARRNLPTEGCLVGDVYLPLLRRGASLAVAPVVRRWWDIGTPRAYLECNLAWVREERHGSWVEGSVCPGVDLHDVLVGPGSIVSGGGALSEVVVWPGAHARAPLSRSIVTTRYVVAAGNL